MLYLTFLYQQIMNYFFTALFSLLLINFSARSQSDDDFMTASSTHFEIYITSDEENVQKVLWEIPSTGEGGWFLDEPIILDHNDIKSIEFGTDYLDRTAMVILLKNSLSHHLSQFQEDYIGRKLCLTFDQTPLYIATIRDDLSHIYRIEAPVIHEFNSSEAYELIKQTWGESNDRIKSYSENFHFSNERIPSGIYLIHETDDFDKSEAYRLGNSEIFISNEPLVNLLDFDSIYFMKSEEERYFMIIEFNPDQRHKISEARNKLHGQRFVIFQDESIWGILDNTSFDADGRISMNMSGEIVLDYVDLYLQKYEWHEDDINLKIIDQFYEEMNARFDDYSGSFDKSLFKESDSNILPVGVYKFTITSFSIDQQVLDIDTFFVEILNKKWMISLVRDVLENEKYEVSNNEFITYQDNEGKLYLNFTTLGLIGFDQQGASLIGRHKKDSWDFEMHLKIQPITNSPEVREIAGEWVVAELIMNDDKQELPISKIKYHFEKNGVLNAEGKSGLWFLSPSQRFFVMMDENGSMGQELFDVVKISNKELVLGISNHAMQVQMKLVKK